MSFFKKSYRSSSANTSSKMFFQEFFQNIFRWVFFWGSLQEHFDRSSLWIIHSVAFQIVVSRCSSKSCGVPPEMFIWEFLQKFPLKKSSGSVLPAVVPGLLHGTSFFGRVFFLQSSFWSAHLKTTVRAFLPDVFIRACFLTLLVDLGSFKTSTVLCQWAILNVLH